MAELKLSTGERRSMLVPILLALLLLVIQVKGVER